nr:gustatory receptor 49 [Papilio xuthus]
MFSKENKKNFLEKNHIQIDFEKVLFPLTLTQYVILSPKYYLCQNYISPNSIFTNFIIISLAMTIFISFLYFSFKYLITVQIYLNDILVFLYYFEHLIYAFGLLVNVLFLIIQSSINVELIIRIQIIINNLKINKRDTRLIIIGNWIFCFLIFLFYLMNVYVQIFHVFMNYVNIFLSIFILMPWDFNIVYAARIIYLLRKETESWIRHLKLLINAKNHREHDNLGNYHWQSILKAYLAIIDAYSTCEKITEIPLRHFFFQIIYHVVLTFIQFITNVQTIIQVIYERFQFKGLNSILLLCGMWTIKHAILLALLCLECENFYTCLKNSQVACLTTAYQNIPVSGRQVCKRLRKEGRKPVQPMTAKGFFQVDAALPLHLFSIVATYTVVLLQFNFL